MVSPKKSAIATLIVAPLLLSACSSPAQDALISLNETPEIAGHITLADYNAPNGWEYEETTFGEKDAEELPGRDMELLSKLSTGTATKDSCYFWTNIVYAPAESNASKGDLTLTDEHINEVVRNPELDKTIQIKTLSGIASKDLEVKTVDYVSPDIFSPEPLSEEEIEELEESGYSAPTRVTVRAFDKTAPDPWHQSEEFPVVQILESTYFCNDEKDFSEEDWQALMDGLTIDLVGTANNEE